MNQQLNELLDRIRMEIAEENFASALQDASELRDELARIEGEQ